MQALLVDSHAHLDHDRFSGEIDAILTRAWEAGVRAMLSIGIGEGPKFMDSALQIARHYNGRPNTPHIYVSAGVHPQEAAKCDTLALANLDALLAEPENIACGEIGLDFYHAENPPIDVQREAFREQMEVAARHKRPILIHCRPGTAFGPEQDAWEQTLAMLEQYWRPTGLGGVLHCFSGDANHATCALDLGFMISFAGNVTYPSAGALRDVAKTIPADRLLVETDCPFLAPMPDRGKRNEPAFVTRTAALLADLRGLPAEELAMLTTTNFFRFFGLTANGERQDAEDTGRLRP